MARFTLKFIFLVTLLLFGMLLGMNMAEKGIYRVAGTPDSQVQSFQLSQNNNQVEVKVLGKTIVSELPNKDQPIPKWVPAKEIKTDKSKETSKKEMSFMSKLGNKLGSIFQIGAEKGLNMIASLIEN